MFFRKGTTVIVLTLLFLTGIFLTAKNFPIKKVQAQNSESVIINEIAWMGTASSSHREWLEFFNSGTSTRDISDWSIFGADTGECLNFSQADGFSNNKISPDGYLLYGNEENIFESLSVDIWDATMGLNNSDPGDVKLFNDSDCGEGAGVIIDEINNTEEWLAGNADELKTMERSASFDWQTSARAGGTPRAKNSAGESESEKEDNPENREEKNPPDSEPDISAGTSFASPSDQNNYQEEDILITELVSDPEDGEKEWVEIKNNSGSFIDLEGWVLEEGSGSQTKLKGEIRSNTFFQIKEIKGNLNNSGDSVFLKSQSGKVIDRVSYGDRSKINSAPDSPLSLARKEKDNWKLTDQKTPGKANIIKNETETKDKKEEIIITEIFPNPKKSDREKEFIELFNTGDKEVDLTGWKLSADCGREYILGRHDLEKYPVRIKPKSYLVIYRSRSFLPLNNNGDNLEIFKPKKNTPLQSLSYSRATPGLSYNRTKNLVASTSLDSTRRFLTQSTRVGDWVWSLKITPGSKNEIREVNKPPQVSFSCPRD